MKRRDFVAGSLLGGAMLTHAVAKGTKEGISTGEMSGTKHHFSNLVNLAQSLSRKDHEEDKLIMAGPFKDLNYDRYRGIRFRRQHDPLKNHQHSFCMDLLPPGQLYNDRVKIYLVDKKKQANEIPFSSEVFDFDPKLFIHEQIPLSQDEASGLSWSGFRLRFPINADEIDDEFVVFQGASYFRAVARDTLYGLSARGLALKTGDTQGEEFPRFSHFWIHAPKEGANSITVDALLESQSITGAYRFEISPGAETVFTVQCRLFPRKTIEKYGIAPLTSMYYFSPTRRNHIDDYRNAVHDSCGLSILTGRQSRLWRPLANPRQLQFSAFMDNNPKGYGLTQRSRSFEDYQDAEARYEMRPSSWVRPLDNWGKGNVTLVEIPTDNEFNDNIITFWHGKNALEKGGEYAFNYQLIWSKTGARFKNKAKIIGSRIGRSINNNKSYTISIDYQFDQNILSKDLLLAATTNKGHIPTSSVSQLPNSHIVRASFEFIPPKKESAELQVGLSHNGESVAEIWLYRWLNS